MFAPDLGDKAWDSQGECAGRPSSAEEADSPRTSMAWRHHVLPAHTPRAAGKQHNSSAQTKRQTHLCQVVTTHTSYTDSHLGETTRLNSFKILDETHQAPNKSKGQFSWKDSASILESDSSHIFPRQTVAQESA